MKGNKHLITRLILSKGTGFIIGLLGFLFLPIVLNTNDLFLRFGILLWYTSLGAIIGIMGFMTRHPYFNFNLPFYIRGLCVGAWMNFVLVFFMYNEWMTISQGTVFAGWSIFWLVVEGALVGLIIDAIATKFGYEGTKLYDKK